MNTSGWLFHGAAGVYPDKQHVRMAWLVLLVSLALGLFLMPSIADAEEGRAALSVHPQAKEYSVTIDAGERGWLLRYNNPEEAFDDYHLISWLRKYTVQVTEGEPFLPQTPISIIEDYYVHSKGDSFAGWYLDEGFTDPIEAHYKYYIDDDGERRQAFFPDRDVHLYAKWNTATITVNAGAGGIIYKGGYEYSEERDSRIWVDKPVKQRKDVINVGHPYHPGYPEAYPGNYFAGWYLDPALTDSFDDHFEEWHNYDLDFHGSDYFASKDITLYAKWVDASQVIASSKVGLFENCEYDGKVQTQNPGVVIGNISLEEGTDYTLSYYSLSYDKVKRAFYKKAISPMGVKNPGIYYVKVTGKGTFSGSTNIKAFRITTAADGDSATKMPSNTVERIGKPKYKNGNAKKSALAQVSSATMETVAIPSKNTMTVSWSKVAGATNYIVGYRSAGKKTWTYYATGGQNSFSFKNMKRGATLEFRVAAYYKPRGMRSEWTQINCRFYREMHALKANMGAGKINISWGKSTGATGYQVLIATKKDMSNARTVTVKGGATLRHVLKTYGGKSLQKGRTYYVKVRPIRTTINADGKRNTYIGIQSLVRTCKVK